MSDETDTTSEVARVADALTDHPDWYIKGESTTERMVYGCQGCTVEVWTDESGSDGGDLTQPRAAFAKHQAAMLAGAGLLREFPGRVDGAGSGETSNNSCPCSACERARTESAQIATQEPAGQPAAPSVGVGTSDPLSARLRALIPATYSDDGYFGVTALEIGEFADEAHRLEREWDGARIKGAQWKARYEETRDANRRVLQVAQWFRGQGQTGYARKVEEAVGGEVQGGSCARCGAGITLPANDPENREMAVCAPCEITVLKEGYRTARAQVEAIRAAITREAAHGEAITRCNLVAERFQAVLDSVTAP